MLAQEFDAKGEDWKDETDEDTDNDEAGKGGGGGGAAE